MRCSTRAIKSLIRCDAVNSCSTGSTKWLRVMCVMNLLVSNNVTLTLRVALREFEQRIELLQYENACYGHDIALRRSEDLQTARERWISIPTLITTVSTRITG